MISLGLLWLHFAISFILDGMNKKSHFYLLTSVFLLSAVLASPPAMAAGKPNYDKKMQLGQLLYFNGNVDQAIKAFRTAASLKPTAFEPHLNLVNIYVQKGEIPQAIDECHEVLKIKEKHRDVHLILGNLLRSQAGNEKDPDEQKKMLKEAEQEVAAAEALGADPAMVHNTIGIIKVQQGDTDGAMKHMEQALSANQKLPDAHLVKGVLHFKKGEKDLALKHLDLAIKHKANKNAEARNTKADILFTMGKVDEAMEEYKKAATDDPRYAAAWSGQGNIHIQRKDYDKAKDCLEKAQAIKADKNVMYSLGVCKEKMGDIAGAVGDFEQGVMLDEDPMMKAQIKLHIQQLRQGQMFKNVPAIGTDFATGIGPNANLANPGLMFGGESFKDMIKIGGTGKEKKKDKE